MRTAVDVKDKGQRSGEACRPYDILEYVPAGVCVISGDDLRVSYANRAGAELLEVPASALEGMPIARALPAGARGLLDVLVAARDSSTPARINSFRWCGGDGVDRMWSIRVTPRAGREGERAAQLILLVADATERTELVRAADRAADAERRRAEQLDAVFASIADAVVLVDDAGKVRKFNAAAETLLNLGHSSDIDIRSPELALSRTDGTAVDADESPLARALRPEVVRGEEALVVRPGRPRRMMSVTAGPVVTDGRVSGAVAVFHDITGIRDAEQRMERALRAERQRAREARTLYHAARAISSDLNLRERLNVVAETMAEAVGVSRCLILLLEGETVKEAAAFGMTAEQTERLSGASLPVRALGRATEEAIEKRRPAYVPDTTSEPLANPRLARSLNMRCALIVPLVYGNRVTGIAYLDEPGREREFGESEKTVATAISAQGAVAIENARLYEVEQDRAHMLEVMMAELNHRVKNNLAIVCGLLALQLTESDPQATKESILRDCITRIQSISLIHQLLHEEDVDAVDMKETARRIGTMVCDTLAAPGQSITCRVCGDRLMLPCKPATSLGLAINELVCNSVKHGLAGRPRGRVTISIKADHRIRITVSDNGRGLPPDFDLTTDGHVGSLVVRGLVESELGGSYTVRNRARGGTTALVVFPASAIAQTL